MRWLSPNRACYASQMRAPHPVTVYDGQGAPKTGVSGTQQIPTHTARVYACRLAAGNLQLQPWAQEGRHFVVHLFVHTNIAQNAGPFSVARLQNGPAFPESSRAQPRSHGEAPALSWAPPGAGLPFVQPPSLHDIAGPLCFAGDIVCAAGELNRLQLRRRVERPHCTRRYSCATTPSPAVETPPIAVGNVVVLEEVSALFMQHIWTIVKHDGPHHLELSGLINPLQPDRTDRTRLGGR